MSYTVRFQDGDFEFGTAGDQMMITGAEKAAQDLLDEIMLPYEALRDRGNALFQPDGSLAKITGSDVIGMSFVKSSIQSAVKRLMQAQADDLGTSPAEVVRRIKTLVVRPLGDVTSYGFFLAVEVNDQNIAISRAIRTLHLGTPVTSVGGYSP